MSLLRLLTLLLLCWTGHARALTLPAGLRLDPPAGFDLTYQALPNDPPDEKALFVWSGDRALYMLNIERLPPAWTAAQPYFASLLRDLRDAGRRLESGASGDYATRSALRGSFLEIRSRSRDSDAPVEQSFHFLSDGKTAFLVIATLLDKEAAAAMREGSRRLLETADLDSKATPTAVTRHSRQPYVGSWRWQGTAPDGKAASARLQLRDDLSFDTEVAIDGRKVFVATGVWEVSDGRLLWTYLRSIPALPDTRKADSDQIVAVDDGHLRLRSSLSGQLREFVRE